MTANPSLWPRLQEYSHRSAVFFAILSGFFIPISTAGLTICFSLSLIFGLFAPNSAKRWHSLRSQPVIWFSLALLLLGIIGLSYGPADLQQGLSMLSKYRELLLIPLLIWLLRTPQQRQWALYSFLLALLLTLIGSYLNAFTDLHLAKGSPSNPILFKNYITQGIFLALGMYFCALYTLHAWQQGSRWGWAWGLLTLACAYNVMFMGQGRTGYALVLALILLFLFQLLRWRGLIIGGLIVTLLSVSAYQFSEPLRQRIDRGLESLEQYDPAQSQSTSIGLRLEFYRHTSALIEQAPLFGYGTGGFTVAYEQRAQEQGIRPSANPHNEYLLITSQWGLPGLLVFLGLLLSIFIGSPRLGKLAPFAQGVGMMMLVGCLVNSLLLDFSEGHAFAYLVGVFFSAYPYSQDA